MKLRSSHFWTRTLLTGVLVAEFVSRGGVSAAAEAPSVEVTDRAQIQKTEVNGFVHPGIGLTKEMLEDARAQVLAKREPWYSGFLKFAANPGAAKTVSSRNQSKTAPARPEVDAFDSGSVEGRLKGDSSTALRQVLMYWFTGDPVYRANALRIVRLWSKMDPAKFKAYHEVYIHCSFEIGRASCRERV